MAKYVVFGKHTAFLQHVCVYLLQQTRVTKNVGKYSTR